MSDPLAQFRKKPLTPSDRPVSAEASEKTGYLAFEGKDKVERLRIRPANAPAQSPLYLHLANIAYDGDFGTNFVLMFGFMNVRVTGQNLQPVILALEMGTADFIQEFDLERWEKPSDDKLPFIATIEIEAQEGGRVEQSRTVH